jgi:predicted GNAT family N-acyltransferase
MVLAHVTAVGRSVARVAIARSDRASRSMGRVVAQYDARGAKREKRARCSDTWRILEQ